MATVVKGVFHRKDRLADAVERLAEQSVPADDIGVFVLDASGEPAREIPVRDESGVLRGALVGAAFGAGLGLVVLLLALTGVFGPVGAELVSARSLVGAIRTVVGGAVAGVPLGAILGMGRWWDRRRISDEEMAGHGAIVTVESDALADVARRVLGEAGADRVTG